MKKLNLKNDLIFKEVFASNDELSRGALSELLSAYIGKEVKDITLIKNEIRSSYFLQKETRMDINATFNDGELADIEMQLVKSNEELIPRMLYYLTQLFMSQPMNGKRYHTLHNTYTILIANFTIFADEEEYHDFRMECKGYLLSDLLHIITIELPKVKERKVEEMNAIQSWNYYFENYEKEEKTGIIELIKKRMEGIAMADKKIGQISPEQVARINQIYDERFALEEKWRYEDALEEKYEQGIHVGKKEGIEEGRAEGKAEGIEEGRAEGLAEGESKGLSKGIKQTQAMMIHKLLKKHTIEEVSELLEISVEEINQLINKN